MGKSKKGVTNPRNRVPTAEDLLAEVSGVRDQLNRQLQREQKRTDILGSLADSAGQLFGMGHEDEARLVLTVIRRIHIDAMQERVSREPGGVEWAAAQNAKIRGAYVRTRSSK